MKSGYLYVLVHPSDPELYKVGVTILAPEERLAQHNSHFEEYAGKIVKATGQKWELKTSVAVPDPYFAEAVFWEATGLGLMMGGITIEVQRMEWKQVEEGLRAVQKAGVRPPPPPRTKPVRNREWMLEQLQGTGIAMIGPYRGLVTGVEFQCEKGHVFKESPGALAHQKTCPCCVAWQFGSKSILRPSLR
jgi:hypothetical protein